MRLLICLLMAGAGLTAFGEGMPGKVLPPFLAVDNHWVDSLLATMSTEEKIGQLFMVSCHSDQPEEERERLEALIRRHHIGGVIFMKGGPVRQVQLTNYFQRISKVPLLIAMDAEWGPAMRLDSLISYPRQMALAAGADSALAFAFGQEVARQLRRLGVHMNFAPVVDVNSNPQNPVIGDRSFGEDPQLVARLGLAYMRGLQQGGVLACAKHFPGHGNTDKDSHHTLPVLTASLEQLRRDDLPPFQVLVDQGVSAVMVAHVSVPALEPTPALPATLSPAIINGLLRHETGFRGLVITDALNMEGARVLGRPGEVELRALLAGNDILLYSNQVADAISRIKEALAAGLLDTTDLNLRVRRILQAKHWSGLSRSRQVAESGLLQTLNTPEALVLCQQMAESGLVLLANAGNLIPLTRLDTFRLATLAISDTGVTAFQKWAAWYAPMQHFTLRRNPSPRTLARMDNELKPYNIVMVALFTQGRQGSAHLGLNEPMRQFLDSLRRRCTVLLTVFGNPYAVQEIQDFPHILLSVDKQEAGQQAAAQAWFGGIALSGRLPVSASDKFRYGAGQSTCATRLAYSQPERAGLSSQHFHRMDTFIHEAIRQQAFPGCQLWIAKNGMVVWHKAYGSYVYDTLIPVTPNTIYDLASLTKIAATTLAAMKLWEEGQLNLNARLETYLPELQPTDKGRIELKDLLLHESGLAPFIAFHESWIKNGRWDSAVFSEKPVRPYTVTVAPRVFMNAAYVDSVWMRILRSPLKFKGRYVYSDLGYYFLQKVVECLSGMPLDQYMYRSFYQPLGLQTMCFAPLRFFQADRIAPSNYDAAFRKQKLQGTVHDPGAALMGGIAGHAGLFAQANDVGIVMTMLLRHGRYGGLRYLDSATVAYFTRQYSERSRRGLGFDRPELQADRPSPTASKASGRTFGHTGFTGTAAWADPEQDVVFVFLSNRTFPDDQNKRINALNVRVRLQEMLYEALEDGLP